MEQPIAVFDSGIGGLTVLAALQRLLPHETFVYFGDTARVPYGTKSPLTVRRYSTQNTRFLMRFGPKMLVVACNTATAAGLDVVAAAAGVPVIGVIEPGARRAARAGRENGGAIGIIGTESTISSRSYYRAIRSQGCNNEIWERACPLLVPMVEEGRTACDPIVRAAAEEYLAPVRGRVSALVLGCTHYPVLKELLADIMGPDVAMIDSAEEVAHDVQAMLLQLRIAAPETAAGAIRCYVSDNPERFRRTGERFMGGRTLRDVTMVEPEEFFPAEDMLRCPGGTP